MTPIMRPFVRPFALGAFAAGLFVFVSESAAVPMSVGGGGAVLPDDARHGEPVAPQGWQVEGNPDLIRAWRAPGGDALAIAGDVVLERQVTVPQLPEEARASEWAGWVGVGVEGVVGQGDGWVRLELVDGEGRVRASQEVLSNRAATEAVRARWVVEDGGASLPNHPARHLVDGDSSTEWRTESGRNHPHHLVFDFGEEKMIEGFRYVLPSGTDGLIREWEVCVSEDGENWEPLADGVFSYQLSTVGEREARFERVVGARYVRWTTNGAYLNSSEARAALLEPMFAEVEPEPDVNPAHTAWVRLEPSDLGDLVGSNLTLRVRHVRGRPIVLGSARGYVLHRRPTEAQLGRANGNNGPDKIGAGALGFDALTEHGQTVFTIMDVRSNSPASGAGLRQGDVVTAVNGRPMRPANLWAGWEWFYYSHEAVLGRAVLEAAEKPSPAVVLTVLRQDEEETLTLNLGNRPMLGAGFPYDGEGTAALYEDLIQYVVNDQHDNGSWRNDRLKTSLAGLGLLGTRDTSHRRRIRNAVDWLLERHPDPTQETGLAFWGIGHMGTFLAEYHLATGDRRVVPWIESAMAWLPTVAHMSSFGYMGLGHGPAYLPYDNKGLVAPAAHLAVMHALGEQFGLQSDFWSVMWPYFEDTWSNSETGGHGGLGYNASMRDRDEFWARSGLMASALNISGQRHDMQAGLTRIMRLRHPWMRNSHAYGEPGGAWGMMTLAGVAPSRYREVMEDWAWSFALSWEPGYGLRYSTPHMGSPYMGEDELINPAYLAVLSARHRGLWITGARDRGWMRGGASPQQRESLLDRLDEPDESGLVSIVQVVGIGEGNENAMPQGAAARMSPVPAAEGHGYPVSWILDFGAEVEVHGLEIAFDATHGQPAELALRNGLPEGMWDEPVADLTLRSAVGSVAVPLSPPVRSRRFLLESGGGHLGEGNPSRLVAVRLMSPPGESASPSDSETGHIVEAAGP